MMKKFVSSVLLVVTLVACSHDPKPPSPRPVRPRATTTSSTTSTSTTTTTLPPLHHVTSDPTWDCIAIAETGGNFTMHGSVYSSAYGVLNAGVREQAQPYTFDFYGKRITLSSSQVADRIISGTATKEEQLAMAKAEAARYGFHAWAPQTQQKCGL